MVISAICFLLLKGNKDFGQFIHPLLWFLPQHSFKIYKSQQNAQFL